MTDKGPERFGFQRDDQPQMASCGKNVEDEIKDDEKYEDWSDDDLDPDKTIDFPTTNCELYTNSKEMLILKDKNGIPIDRRVQVFFNRKEFHSESYFMLSQLTVKLRSGILASGSGICLTLAKNPFFLSCAHNLVSLSARRKCLVPYVKLKVYKARNGEDSYVASGMTNKKEILPHPKYDGYNEHGWDIGIFRVGELKKGKFSQITHGPMNTINDDVMLHWANEKLLTKGMAVEIAGYPGEKKGYPYKHKGTIEDIKMTEYGSYLIWYNADTTLGNSGSSIMVTDQNFVKSVAERPGIKKIIIGVHSGYDNISKLNYGTLITEGVYDWIKANW